MAAIMGNAELDEGNVFEAPLEGWKHDVRILWRVNRRFEVRSYRLNLCR